ncbi:hypothetical protein ANTQUA_LOCUS1200 [Anthophora quadrimaculata]
MTRQVAKEPSKAVDRSQRGNFFFYPGRQVQSPSPADIISVNVARVYPHTYLTNSSRTGPTSRSAAACYLKKQSLSHEITFRPDCLVHCIPSCSSCLFAGIPGAAEWVVGMYWETGKGYESVKNNFLPLICGGLDEEKSPGRGDIKILFEGCLG